MWPECWIIKRVMTNSSVVCVGFHPPPHRYTDRDNILVFIPMSLCMSNPMITLEYPYDSLLARNLKWLTLKLRFTSRNHIHLPGTYEPYFIFFTGTYTNMKSGCHHHQIGMNYLYHAIFKMAASEVKLRFRL